MCFMEHVKYVNTLRKFHLFTFLNDIHKFCHLYNKYLRTSVGINRVFVFLIVQSDFVKGGIKRSYVAITFLVYFRSTKLGKLATVALVAT